MASKGAGVFMTFFSELLRFEKELFPLQVSDFSRLSTGVIEYARLENNYGGIPIFFIRTLELILSNLLDLRTQAKSHCFPLLNRTL